MTQDQELNRSHLVDSVLRVHILSNADDLQIKMAQVKLLGNQQQNYTSLLKLISKKEF